MPASVFPDAFNGPLSLGPGQISMPITVPETVGGTPRAVHLRIIMLGAGCEPPKAPPPTFQLRAGAGNPVDLLPDDPAVFIYDQPTGARADPLGPVADAQLFIESEHVYAITISIRRPGSTCQLRITNNDDAERKFTWVVADNEPEAAQPWLNLPQTLRFNGEVGKRVPQSLDVPNLGTGNLTISLGGLATDSKFQLDLLPADIAPNHCGTLIITFNAPATAGPTEELYTAKTNDKQATESAQHNDRIRLIATTTAAAPRTDVQIIRAHMPPNEPNLVDFLTAAPIEPDPEGVWQVTVLGVRPPPVPLPPISRTLNVSDIPLITDLPPPVDQVQVGRLTGEIDGKRSYQARIFGQIIRVIIRVAAPGGDSSAASALVTFD